MLSLLSKLSQGLAKTRAGLIDGLAQAVRGRRIDEELLSELEERLILGDVGAAVAESVIEDLRKRVFGGGPADETAVLAELKRLLQEQLEVAASTSEKTETARPLVISVVGVNGSGKTTTAAKLAALYFREGKKVLLAAADTFRAAAADQLQQWGERIGVDVIRTQPGADPAALAFDALQAAVARGVDVLLIDTAGRLHTKANLMAELSKIHRVLGKIVPDAPHQVLLVLDAVTGRNGLSQAAEFARAAGVTGLVLTKMDGTAKGGIIFSIARELGLPVRYIGVGEQIDDLAPFDPRTFVDALFQ